MIEQAVVDPDRQLSMPFSGTVGLHEPAPAAGSPEEWPCTAVLPVPCDGWHTRLVLIASLPAPERQGKQT